MEQWLLDLGVEVETVEVELWVACVVVVVEEVTMIYSAVDVVVYDGVGDHDDRDDDYYDGGDVMDKSSSMVSSTVLAAAVVHLFPMVQSHCHHHCYCGHCCHSCQTMIS